MDYSAIKESIHPNATLPLPFIPHEIIAEILCFLSVKTILQLKCVSKTWKTLISDPAFIQKHFHKSSQNPHLLFTPPKTRYPMRSVKFFPMLRLFETDPSIRVSNDNFHGRRDKCEVAGTCNGLVCLFSHYRYQKYWFHLWNPATRTLSEKLGIFQDCDTIYDTCRFTFGCDISTGTYKVVALCKVGVQEANTIISVRNEFRVLSLGDNCWRNFPNSGWIPVCMIYPEPKGINNGLHLNGTVNWLALPNGSKPCYDYYWKFFANPQFVIVSLDLSTETCTQFLLPPGFSEGLMYQPTLNVLMDCLCFSHEIKGSGFLIWQIKEFGVQSSWTQLFKINYFDISSYIKFDTPLWLLYLSKNGDTVILANYEDDQAVIYNEREKRGKTIRIAKELSWFSAMDYVESLVSPCLKPVSPTPDTPRVMKYGRNVYFNIG